MPAKQEKNRPEQSGLFRDLLVAMIELLNEVASERGTLAERAQVLLLLNQLGVLDEETGGILSEVTNSQVTERLVPMLRTKLSAAEHISHVTDLGPLKIIEEFGKTTIEFGNKVIKLASQPAMVLNYLRAQPDELVSNQDLHAVMELDGTETSKNVILRTQIAIIRSALDSVIPGLGDAVVTARKTGYTFDAELAQTIVNRNTL